MHAMVFRVTAGLAVLFALQGVTAADGIRQPGPHPESAALENPVENNDAAIGAARQVYAQLCVTCHGLDGKGKTDTAAQLTVAMPDFTDTEWKYGASDGEIFTIIRDGTPNGMEPFKDKVNERRMWSLVHYLRTFAATEGATAAAAKVPENPIALDDDSVRKGLAYYRRLCVKCHGDDGRGDTEMREFLATHPSDLTDSEWKYGGRDGDLFNVIKNGTAYDMEAFADRLTDENIWHVVNYLKYNVKKE